MCVLCYLRYVLVVVTMDGRELSRLRVQISHMGSAPKASRRAADIMVRANRAAPSPAERASPEDCAALLNWGSPGSPSRPRTGLSSCQRGGPDAAQVGKAQGREGDHGDQ